MRLLDKRRFYVLMAIISVYFFYDLVFGATGEGEAGGAHGGPILETLLELIIILLAAKLGGDFFERFHQPAVLGELVMGMIIGNLSMLGIDAFEPFKNDQTLEVLAELGVIILLFEVGLESTVREMMKVGVTSFLVATFGVIAPFFLGWWCGVMFLPHEGMLVHIFIGATLTATSVGITARVLKDLGKVNTKEAKIILGAAVIDDILGLIILAVVTGVITAAAHGGEGGVSSGAILWIIAKAFLFILGAIVAGQFVLPQFFKLVFRIQGNGVFLSFCLMICFLLAWIAGRIGLAPIVGAFAAGLILEEVQYHQFRERGDHPVEELLRPIAIFLVPIFFVRMGMMVDLRTFANVEILGFAATMTLLAIIGKQACSLAIFDRTTHRLIVGVGMIPRGEVGLIFAEIGRKMVLNGEAVILPSTYSAVVIMVILTTLVTPPALKTLMLRADRKAAAKSSSTATAKQP